MSLPIYTSLTYSPTWYSANALDTLEWDHDDKSGIFYYGAKNSIYFIKVNEIMDDTKIINDQTNRNFYYDAKLCFFMKAHHEFIVGVYTLTNEVLLPFENEKKIAKLISCGKDKMIRVWSFNESSGCCCLKELNISTSTLSTNATCISVSNRNIAACGFEKGFLLSWNYVTDEWKTFATESEDIVCIVWNGDKLAVGYKRGIVSVFMMEKYDTLSKLTRFRAHHSDTCNICWNPYPETVDIWGDIATTGKDCRVSLWQINTNVNITTLKLPNPGRNRIQDGSSSTKEGGSTWSSLCWSNIDNGTMIVSTAFGNLGLWKSPSATELKCFPHNSQIKGHNKTVFGINEWRNYRGLLVSHSLDRTINISRVSVNGTMEGCVYSMPGFGGAVMSLSGVGHTNQLAIGCGDNNIRLWKYDAQKRRSYDVTAVWNGVNGKVLTVCWHPYREGLLAFGTEDGQVGIVNIAKDKKLAISSAKHHNGKVFVVSWGVNLQRQVDGATEDSLIVYSVGNYSLYGHDFRAEDYFDATAFVCDNNDGISDFCVHSSLRYAAVGYRSGMVGVFSMSPMSLVCTIKSHSKGVNCMRWSLHDSGAKLAIGSNERFLTVTDLSVVFADFVRNASGPWTTLELVETLVTLKGHGDRITCVDWSPFDEDKLVTGSYDNTAFVWSLAAQGPVASFNCHQGKLLCCHWSRRDPDLLYTGSDDCNLFSWRLSDQRLQSRVNKRRQGHEVPGIGAGGSRAVEVPVEPVMATVVEESGDKVAPVVDGETAKSSAKKPYVKKRTSLFPKTLFAVHHSLEDYQQSIIKFVNEEPGYLACFTMFGSRSAILDVIEEELEIHVKEGNLDNYFMILIWIGKIGRVMREVVSRNYSPDWLMAILFGLTARSVPDDLVQTMIANIISERKDPVLAATCHLSVNDTMRAIDLLIGHQCYREALILAKLRLAADHPLITNDLLLQLQVNYYRNGSYEMAAMCSLSMGNYRGFVDTLQRRGSPLASWVIIKTMSRTGQAELLHQCAGTFVSGLLVQEATDVGAVDCKQWLDRVRTEACLGPYSVLVAVHEALWTDRLDLDGIVSVTRAGCDRCSRETMMSLHRQVRARLSARQPSQSERHIWLHITYELFASIVGCLYRSDDDAVILDSLLDCLHQLYAINAADKVLDRLLPTVDDDANDEECLERIKERLRALTAATGDEDCIDNINESLANLEM